MFQTGFVLSSVSLRPLQLFRKIKKVSYSEEIRIDTKPESHIKNIMKNSQVFVLTIRNYTIKEYSRD
jgi:hypothetical protein